MKKNTWLSLFTVVLIASCTGAGSATALSPLPHSMKGYELYSWQPNGEWRFTLITGTNCNKTREEITSTADALTPDGWVKVSVTGIDALKRVLSRLPAGEEIVWMGIEQPQIGNYPFPPAETTESIRKYCQQRGLVIFINQ